MTAFYHATSAQNAEKILSEGMREGSYWGEEDIASYYAETVQDDGETPVIIIVELEDLISLGEEHIAPDHAGIEEPLTFTLGMKEDEVMEAWEECEGTWRDSLEIIRSFRVMAPIPASMMRVEEPENRIGIT